MRSSLTPTHAAQKAMRVRGHVVVGFPPETDRFIAVGELLTDFAGGFMDSYNLRVESVSDRQDWVAQFQLLFPGQQDPNQPCDKQRFFRCKLVKVT